MKNPIHIVTIFSSPAASDTHSWYQPFFLLATVQAISDIIDRFNQQAMALFDIKKRQQRQF